MSKQGTVLYGINNIFTVQSNNINVECRIKGKILGEKKTDYNPLAPGDKVIFEEDKYNTNAGMILERLPRKNTFSRWNNKKKTPQTIAVNVDAVCCVTSPASPEFRPRFIDRVLATASIHELPGIVILNKSDQKISKEIENRIGNYKEIGCQVYVCSAYTGENLELVKDFCKKKTIVLMGQSGVGKSTLINYLTGRDLQKVGNVSEKHNKGIHTTCFSILIPYANGAVIDTPGIREIQVYGIEPEDLQRYFTDIFSFADKCSLPGCVHIHEPECAVKNAMAANFIHPDRYESYIRVFESLVRIKDIAYG